MKILENHLIKNFSTMKIGGICRKIYFPENANDIVEIKKTEVDPLILGQLSNVLITDDYFERAIVILQENYSKIYFKDGFIFAESGATMNGLSNFALENSIKNFEFMEGIPGSIGGGIFMNAGAYGGEFKDVVKYVTVVRDEKILNVDISECDFGKRHSVFQDTGDIILGASFFAEKGNYDEIKSLVDDLHQRRADKQPLEYPSCGSVFKRPEGYYASKLIDDLNLKGTRVGGAMVSPKHAGFIINYDNAKFSDVIELIKLIQKTVKDKEGVDLETELKIIEK